MSTPHIQTSLTWNGLGVNETYSEDFERSMITERMHAEWVRVPLSINDPGKNAVGSTDAAFDELWASYAARVAYSGLVTSTMDRVIFYGGDVPRSWLTNTRELRGDALLAYAKLVTSAVIAFRNAGVTVSWVEVCERPDSSFRCGTPLLTPDNYVILVRAFRAHLTIRNTGAVKVLGPSLSRVISASEYTEPYVSAFAKQTPLDAWSLHVTEPVSDAPCFNAGTYGARTYIGRALPRTLMFMRWISPDIPVFVTTAKKVDWYIIGKSCFTLLDRLVYFVLTCIYSSLAPTHDFIDNKCQTG